MRHGHASAAVAGDEIDGLKDEFDRLLGPIDRRETWVVIEDAGVPVAAVVAVADLRRLARFDREDARQAAEDRAAIDRQQERNRDADPKQVQCDVTEAVEEVRRDMDAGEQGAAASRR